jgi:hypothetical protein
MKDDQSGVFDRKSCNYFKADFTVPSTQLDLLRKSINTGELPSLNFRAMSVCKDLPGRERDIIFNKYLISSICWLRSWKNQIASFTPQERKYMVDHSNSSYTDIEHDLVEQIQLLKGQIRSKRMGSVVVLAMKDHYGKSLLHEITEEISSTTRAMRTSVFLSGHY